MAKLLNEYPEKIYLGKRNNCNVYISKPSWDCNWYWGFGYLGNSCRLYHVDGLKYDIKHYRDNNNKPRTETTRCILFDGFKNHFDGDSFIIKDDKDLWKLCELFETFYQLRETAELFIRGGMNVIENNPLKDIIQNKEISNNINENLLPKLFDEIYKILLKHDGLRKKNKNIY